jgi:hypothetical protein
MRWTGHGEPSLQEGALGEIAKPGLVASLLAVSLLGNRLDRDLAGCLVDEVETE